MSIYNKQIQSLVSSELLKYLLLGISPDVNEISKRLEKALNNNSKITYKYYPQNYKEVFNTKLYNKAMSKIKFDIDLFNEELIDLFSKAAERLNFSDLYYKINSYELNRLEKELMLLLFVNKNTDFYFDGFFDSFSDVTKIDKVFSTNDIVDLSEECILLPYGGNNTKRINVGNLVDDVTTSITLSVPSSEIVSNTQIPNTKFGNIFTDVLAIWGHQIELRENVPLSITFTFPLNRNNNISSEFFVSRFEITPHGTKKQFCNITTSNDDVNYISLGGVGEIVLENQSKVKAIDFETTLVEYVRVTLTKKEADEEILVNDQRVYRYTFGLKRFAAFQTGRIQSATYVSKPISFKNTEFIGKVAIEVKEESPRGTNINYSIASIADDGTESSFIPVTAIGGQISPGASPVVTFTNSVSKQERFTTALEGEAAPQVYGTSFQGKQFYRIGPELEKKPIFNSSKLYRGFKSWYRDISGTFENINISDNYVSFESTDSESLYITLSEVPVINVQPVGQDGIRRTRLTLSKPPYYDSAKGHLLKPNPGTNVGIDSRPNYAIYKIIQNVTTSRQTRTFTLNTSFTQNLPISNFILYSSDSSQLPVIRLGNGQIYEEGRDFVFDTQDVGGIAKPTGRISIPTGSAFISNGAVQPLLLQFIFTIDPDITHKVASITNTNVILDNSTITQYDSIQVLYRHLLPVNSIIPASIRISDLPSTAANRTFYVEGRDYVIDATTGAIQRIPTGRINTTSSIYSQYTYRASSSSLQTFTIWAFVPSEGSQIKFDLDDVTKANKLIADATAGEAFYLNTALGLVNLTKTVVTPILPKGWVQFIVRSKNPNQFSAFRSNLIDQVIQIKDINKKKIFRSYNLYFNELTAFRESMAEKTLNHLKVNTLLSDRTVFAIDSITDFNKSYIVVNFQPNQTPELYNRIPTADSDETNPPEIGEEEFLFTYFEEVDSSTAPKKIRVKIELNRNKDVDGGVTPKVFEYQVRVGT